MKFTGSHGHFAAHFSPDDTGVRTCTECPESVLTEMSGRGYHNEFRKKREDKAKRKQIEEQTAAKRVVKKQKRVSDTCMCNRYAASSSRSEVDNQLGKAVFTANSRVHRLFDF